MELLHQPGFGGIMRQAATQPWRFTVRLIGIFLSPYVRRVAISLNLLNLPFEEDQVFVFGEPDVVRRYNPLVRIPALVLDDGTNLVESGAILDEIDHMVGPERRLTPSDGLPRRRVLQDAAMALGCADKAQWAFYEDRVRPAEKAHTPWIQHNDRQVLGGFEHLNVAAAKINDGGWIAGTPQISQADVTTTAAFTFANLARPQLELTKRFPQLARFVERCEALPAFLKAPLPSSSRLMSVLAQPFVS
jgi:glutathione S-transferase